MSAYDDWLRGMLNGVARGEKSLSAALEDAWRAGYEAQAAEERSLVTRPCPPVQIELMARRAMRAAFDPVQPRLHPYADRALPGVVWTWDEDRSAWHVSGHDCTIRPGCNGVIVMEAAGEYAGVVISEAGVMVRFRMGTFR